MIPGKRVVPSSRDNSTCSLYEVLNLGQLCPVFTWKIPDPGRVIRAWEILSIITVLKWLPDPSCPGQKGQTVYMKEVISG